MNTPSGPKDLTPPLKLGTSASVQDAKNYFLTQWGPNEFNDPPRGSDVPYGYKDCGPTSAVMALSALGIMTRPSAADASIAIDHMRDQIYGYDSTQSHGLGLGPANYPGTVAYGLVAAGADVAMIKNNRTDLDAAIDRGNPVIIGTSNTYDAWGRDQLLAGNYLNGGNPGGHFVTVLGRTANGNYIVGDPLVKGGPIEVTAAQMDKALAGAFSTDSLAEVSLHKK